MLNPELKEIYDESVLTELKVLADWFEKNNTVAYVWGVTDDIMRAPEAIFYDNISISKESSIIISDCSERYSCHLTPKEQEVVDVLSGVPYPDVWGRWKEQGVLLWV